MDLATIVGIGVAFFAIGSSVLISGANPLLYFDVASIFIVIIGSTATIVAMNPLSRFMNIPVVAMKAMQLQRMEFERTIRTLVEFSERARREGLLALEDNLQEVEDEFMRKGIQLVVDGTDPELIKSVMGNELSQIQARHGAAIKIFDDWSKQGPAWGMLGTLLGLIMMLGNLGGDKTAIGKGMGTAMITSLYGAIMCYALFIPIKVKLEDKDKEETLMKELVMEGVLSIQAGDNPRILLEKLVAFLPPKQRESMRQESAKE
jgi:chemotaxis protein MotA